MKYGRVIVAITAITLLVAPNVLAQTESSSSSHEAESRMMHPPAGCGGMMGGSGMMGSPGMMGGPGMGMMGEMMRSLMSDPKTRGQMMEIHGRMMKEMGELMEKRGQELEQQGK